MHIHSSALVPTQPRTGALGLRVRNSDGIGISAAYAPSPGLGAGGLLAGVPARMRLGGYGAGFRGPASAQTSFGVASLCSVDC